MSWPTSRQRIRDLRTPVSGTYYWSVTGKTVTATGLAGKTDNCEDVANGFGQDNYFKLDSTDRFFPVLNGIQRNSSGVITRKFDHYPIDFRPGPPSVAAYYPQPTLNELDAIWLHAQAVTNPSRPAVSLPTFIGELRDLPMLVKDWGGNLLRKVAKGHISWRFALAPMISDLQKMNRFMELAQQRFRYLERLRKGKWVRRRVDLGSDSTTVTAGSRTTIHSNGATITAYRDIVYTRKEWCTLRWKLKGSLPFSVKERYDLADRLVRGITSYEALRTAWELTPWSWAIDWFYDVGDFLSAHQNTVPVTAGGFCYMRHTTSTTVYRDVVKPDWVSLSGEHRERHEIKLRLVPSVDPLSLPTLTVPFLTKGQWSILGSLAALKWKR